MISSDGKTRDLVSTIPGAGWDFGIDRHPYFEIERPLKPHYTVYNRRLMACCFDHSDTVEGYWRLRRTAGVLHTGEFPLQFTGPDAERLLDRLFTKDMTKLKVGRCGYGLACYEDGTLITDGIVLRLDTDRFWYAQADGDFYSWARAHGAGLDVDIVDPRVFVSQVQGPRSLEILAAASDHGMPEPFGYFGGATVHLGGQRVTITRTGYTNELGWEFYTEPHHDAPALWAHLTAAGEDLGMALIGLDAMNIRRIEAGILNAGSDFDSSTTPYDVGLGRFVDTGKADFIGRQALEDKPSASRLFGISCQRGQPLIGGAITIAGQPAGKITAGATSPYLGHGIGLALVDEAGHEPAGAVSIACTDGELHHGQLRALPFYDREAAIPRGKLVDIPERR